MLNGNAFYHQHIRKAVISFGTIFNNIQIRRTDAEGAIVQSLTVPLHYAPKQKVLSRVRTVDDLQQDRAKYSYTLPRMAFEIMSLRYDPTRHLNTMQTLGSVQPNGSLRTVYTAAPYNIGFRLSLFAKNQEDGLQILEQILPYFTPDFNVTINELPEIGVKRDLNVTLDNVTYDDQYEGDFSERVTIIWELSFTMKMNLYGYVNNAEVIKKVIANIYAENTDGSGAIGDRYTGTATGTADNYTFVEEFEEIFLGDG